jgi:glucose/mannose transport system permease protein
MLLAGYVGTIAWSIQISLTNSKALPNTNFVGLQQYQRLFSDDRWRLSVDNIVIFGVLFVALCLVVGFLLAVAIDRKVHGEDLFRTVVLYPYAMSFIVTGLVWQWLMNPTLGIQRSVRLMGWEGFTFDWVVNPDMAIYALVIAGVWQSSGLVMAILLAGLRGVDPELWKAARIDGIPPWRYYVSIVLPLLRPMIITCVVLLSIGVVRAYDLVVALTRGGPGLSTQVPATFVMEFLFQRANIALATAASTVMLVTVLAFLAPFIYFEYFRKRAGAHA